MKKHLKIDAVLVGSPKDVADREKQFSELTRKEEVVSYFSIEIKGEEKQRIDPMSYANR